MPMSLSTTSGRSQAIDAIASAALADAVTRAPYCRSPVSSSARIVFVVDDQDVHAAQQRAVDLGWSRAA